MSSLNRRGFLSILSMMPLAGLTLGKVEPCTISAYNGDTLVAGPFVAEFRMNSIMKVHISEGHQFRMDRLVMKAPAIGRNFEQKFEAITIVPALTLDIDWAVQEQSKAVARA